MTDKKTVSGFDMGPTIAWYWANLDELVRTLPVVLGSLPDPTLDFPFCKKPIDVADGHFEDFPFNGQMLAGATRIYMPPEARARSSLRSVKMEAAQWFHKDSAGEKPVPTSDIALALSPTAIIPSYAKYEHWDTGEAGAEAFGFATDVKLYRIPGIGMADPYVTPTGEFRPTLRRLIYMQALLHELWHSVTTPILYGGKGLRKLRLSDGQVVDEYDYLMAYQAIVMTHDPVSHYASAYSNNDRTLKERDGDPRSALGEHIVEALTALGLGFAFRTDGTGLEPFAGRDPMKAYLEPFLNAEWVD